MIRMKQSNLNEFTLIRTLTIRRQLSAPVYRLMKSKLSSIESSVIASREACQSISWLSCIEHINDMPGKLLLSGHRGILELDPIDGSVHGYGSSITMINIISAFAYGDLILAFHPACLSVYRQSAIVSMTTAVTTVTYAILLFRSSNRRPRVCGCVVYYIDKCSGSLNGIDIDRLTDMHNIDRIDKCIDDLISFVDFDVVNFAVGSKPGEVYYFKVDSNSRPIVFSSSRLIAGGKSRRSTTPSFGSMAVRGRHLIVCGSRLSLSSGLTATGAIGIVELYWTGGRLLDTIEYESTLYREEPVLAKIIEVSSLKICLVSRTTDHIDMIAIRRQRLDYIGSVHLDTCDDYEMHPVDMISMVYGRRLSNVLVVCRHNVHCISVKL